jgi:hypothetical protein|tara:strand:+ start:79 stop:264 length:186 start_codon:yes stop_codon:yes gene_type:complete
MAYHIKKPSVLKAETSVYYTGESIWSETFDDRKVYSDDPSSLLTNNDGKNGGWTGATIVSE